MWNVHLAECSVYGTVWTYRGLRFSRWPKSPTPDGEGSGEGVSGLRTGESRHSKDDNVNRLHCAASAGRAGNFKVTHPEDLARAEAVLAARKGS